VLAKNSKNFSLEDNLSLGVDRMQRNSTDAEAGGKLASTTAVSSGGKVDDLPGARCEVTNR
jgi:hypothetical protein